MWKLNASINDLLLEYLCYRNIDFLENFRVFRLKRILNPNRTNLHSNKFQEIMRLLKFHQFQSISNHVSIHHFQFNLNFKCNDFLQRKWKLKRTKFCVCWHNQSRITNNISIHAQISELANNISLTQINIICFIWLSIHSIWIFRNKHFHIKNLLLKSFGEKMKKSTRY